MSELFVYAFFFGTLLFLFPIFVYTDGYLDVRENRLWFSVSLYKHLKLFGGYAQLDREGIAVHLTKKKAVFIGYGKMTDTRKKFEITQGFQLWRFHQIVETCGAEKIYGILLAAGMQAIGGAAFSYLQTKYPFISLKNGILLTESPNLKITLQVAAVFNGLVLSVAIAKKLLEVFINWIRSKKSTAYSKRRRNSSQAL